jgi:hypothetical protein
MSGHRWKGNVKIAPKETGFEVMDWIYSAPDMDKWQALVNMVMNLLTNSMEQSP